jgi:hypothetical protein
MLANLGHCIHTSNILQSSISFKAVKHIGRKRTEPVAQIYLARYVWLSNHGLTDFVRFFMRNL